MRHIAPVLLSVLLGLLLPGCATPKQSSPTPEEAEFAGVLLDSIHRRVDEMENQDVQFYAAVVPRPQRYWNGYLPRDMRCVFTDNPVRSAAGVCDGSDVITALRGSGAVVPLEGFLKRMREAWKVVWMGEGEQALLAGYP